MELLLVLAILVIAAAASMPAIRALSRGALLRDAADRVRVEWTRAHVKAMKTGRIHVFLCELGGSHYKVQPYIAGDDSLENASTDPSGPGTQAQSPAHKPVEGTLPDGTKFVAGDVVDGVRSESLEENVMSDNRDKQWSRPVLFYPDGSTVDAYVIVGDERDKGIRLDLRGMTAVVTLGEVGHAKELEAAAK